MAMRGPTRLVLLAALLCALLCGASAARFVSDQILSLFGLEANEEESRAKATARRAELHKRFKPSHAKARIQDDDDGGGSDSNLDPAERNKKNLEKIRRFLEQGEMLDKWQLRQEGMLPKDEEADARVYDELGEDPGQFCLSRNYRKRMMKLIKDAPFIGLFNDLRNLTRFEGSSITYANGSYWVVFDSLRTIGKVGLQFQFRGKENALIPEDAEETESQFEGLQYMPSTDSFLAVRESVMHEHLGLVPLTEEIRVNGDHTQWTVDDVCPVKFHGLEDPNKGWEGLHYYEKDGERYLLGLCESNYCKTILGPNPPGLHRGNGRLIMTRYVKNTHPHGNNTDPCRWEVLREIKLPPEAHFLDYAGIAFHPHPFGSEVSIVSQEDAAVYLGQFDWETMEFLPGGQVYAFPRDHDCRKVFCNVEGLTFLDARRLLFASDRSKPIQSFACMGRDQSVHVLALP